MGRNLRAFLLTIILVGCNAGTPIQFPIGFVNRTQHSDAELWNIWKIAQSSLSEKVDMNPLQRSLENAPPDIRPGNPAALNLFPRQVRVAAHADVLASVLKAATGVDRTDPTGLIACPQTCNVRYSVAYSRYSQPPLVRYAASWEFQGDNFSMIVEYEFENQIMNALGYNMRWR